jgi:hypothetical protein
MNSEATRGAGTGRGSRRDTLIRALMHAMLALA